MYGHDEYYDYGTRTDVKNSSGGGNNYYPGGNSPKDAILIFRLAIADFKGAQVTGSKFDSTTACST